MRGFGTRRLSRRSGAGAQTRCRPPSGVVPARAAPHRQQGPGGSEPRAALNAVGPGARALFGDARRRHQGTGAERPRASSSVPHHRSIGVGARYHAAEPHSSTSPSGSPSAALAHLRTTAALGTTSPRLLRHRRGHERTSCRQPDGQCAFSCPSEGLRWPPATRWRRAARRAGRARARGRLALPHQRRGAALVKARCLAAVNRDAQAGWKRVLARRREG